MVVHSWYWRSAHWSLEFEYFFQIQASAELRQEFIEQNSMQRVDATGTEAPDRYFDRYFHDKPAWFLPKARDRYEVWASGSFLMYVDKESGDLFLTECQV